MTYKLYSYDKIPSTQVLAHQMVLDGTAIDRTVVLAAAQSAGYGRYHRQWVSHHGNLYASFIFDAHSRDPRLSYSVAVAVAETIISFGISPKIKWPNDILIDDKKVCGILIEYSRDFAIVGIGINIKSNPTVKNYLTTKLEKYSKGLTREDVLPVLMAKLDAAVKVEFSAIRDRWLELAAKLNSEVLYQGKPAILCGINNDGALVLRRSSGYIIAYGDEIRSVPTKK